jgi:hypothetical protein
MLLEAKNFRRVIGLSFLSTLSLLLLFSQRKTPALANANLADVMVQQNQADYFIVRDKDDDDRDRDRGGDRDRDRDRGGDDDDRDRDRDRGGDDDDGDTGTDNYLKGEVPNSLPSISLLLGQTPTAVFTRFT